MNSCAVHFFFSATVLPSLSGPLWLRGNTFRKYWKHTNPLTSNQTCPGFNTRTKLRTFNVQLSELRLVMPIQTSLTESSPTRWKKLALSIFYSTTRPTMKPGSSETDAVATRRKRVRLSSMLFCWNSLGKKIRLVPRTIRVTRPDVVQKRADYCIANTSNKVWFIHGIVQGEISDGHSKQSEKLQRAVVRVGHHNTPAGSASIFCRGLIHSHL